MKVHFIAIGGSIMHNLAIALAQKGYQITGSDDEIYEPSAGRLRSFGLLPEHEGWFPDKVTQDLDAVILGMHARKDNPELLKAQELGLKVYSFPEYIYQQSMNKERVVIAGSHGKTTITAMIVHVLNFHQKKFDYAVGATLEGLDGTVRLTEDAPIIIIEGDEYFSSPIDPTPKFMRYQHHIGLVSGIAWDHFNIFPNFEDYVHQFELFAASTPKAGTIIYCEEDDLATVACTSNNMRSDVNRIAYNTHLYEVKNGTTYLIIDHTKIAVRFFGAHNMQNVNAAKSICSRIGINDDMFYQAIQSFKGAAKRLELVGKNDKTAFYRDFGHAPSKIEATTKAVKEQFPDRKLVACAELHTYSSLNKGFIPQYKNTLDKADIGIVYYNPKTVEHKRLSPISEQEIKQAFGNEKINVFTDANILKEFLIQQSWTNANLLMMSSGTYDNINLKELAEKVLG
jgi:UDP-N-acetylmuramate: L-alanyl-gamma-D-glutamyl-meso-diaminopimelate ligase